MYTITYVAVSLLVALYLYHMYASDEVRQIIDEVPKQREKEKQRQKRIQEWKSPEMQSWLSKFDEAIRKLKEKLWVTQSSNGGEAVEGTVSYEGEV